MPTNNTEDSELSRIVHQLHGRAYLDGDTPNMDYPAQAIKELKDLLLKARLDEINHIDNPLEVNVYYEGLQSLAERKAEITAQLNQKEE